MTEDIFKYINLSRIAIYHVPTLITPTIEYVWVVWEDSILCWYISVGVCFRDRNIAILWRLHFATRFCRTFIWSVIRDRRITHWFTVARCSRVNKQLVMVDTRKATWLWICVDLYEWGTMNIALSGYQGRCSAYAFSEMFC